MSLARSDHRHKEWPGAATGIAEQASVVEIPRRLLMLFVTERDHGIDTHGAARGDAAGGDGD